MEMQPSSNVSTVEALINDHNYSWLSNKKERILVNDHKLRVVIMGTSNMSKK